MPERRTVRQVMFTREDSDAFARALLDHFGQGVCLSRHRSIEAPIRFHATLGECTHDDCWIGFPEDDWRPEITPNHLHFGIGLASYPLPGFGYRTSHEVYKREWDEMPDKIWEARSSGIVSMWRHADDPEHEAFVKAVLKILNRVSTSRLVPFDARSGEIGAPGRSLSAYRLGLDAARWALESGDRYFETLPGGGVGLLRPEPNGWAQSR